MNRNEPGIRVSNPHESPNHGVHRDITFDPGRLPGQVPLPFPKLHEPVRGPWQAPLPGMPVPGRIPGR